MIKLSNVNEYTLMELLRRTAFAEALGATAEPELAIGDRAPVDRRDTTDDAAFDVEGCEDLHAPHDLAALQEGHLSLEGVRRLAGHLKRCESCRIFFAGLVAELGAAESTGMHRKAPELQQVERAAERPLAVARGGEDGARSDGSGSGTHLS